MVQACIPEIVQGLTGHLSVKEITAGDTVVTACVRAWGQSPNMSENKKSKTKKAAGKFLPCKTQSSLTTSPAPSHTAWLCPSLNRPSAHGMFESTGLEGTPSNKHPATLAG